MAQTKKSRIQFFIRQGFSEAEIIRITGYCRDTVNNAILEHLHNTRRQHVANTLNHFPKVISHDL